MSEHLSLSDKDMEGVLEAIRKELLIPDLCHVTFGLLWLPS